VRAVWRFLKTKRNRDIVAWLGGGMVVILSGLWTAATFVSTKRPLTQTPVAHVEASGGGVAIGGSVSDSTITGGDSQNVGVAVPAR
jgi:hypothetical protein